MYCVPYKVIRYTDYSGVLRFASILTGQDLSMLGPAARVSAFGTSTALVEELVDSGLCNVSIYFSSKALLEKTYTK